MGKGLCAFTTNAEIRTIVSLIACPDGILQRYGPASFYITNLIRGGVDPKTVQYLAGYENSEVTMDIYAELKYNKS